MSEAPPTIPSCTIIEEVAATSAVVIYKAWHAPLHRLVALTVVREGWFDEATALCFLDELQRALAVQHPHLVAILDRGVQGGRLFFACEAVDGTSLRQRLQGAAVPPRQAALLAKMLANALAALHDHQLVHGGLTPSSIVLPAGKFLPRITDFGLARHLGTQDASALVYRAPEQLTGATLVPPTDVYALGAILYELLTGRTPFHGSTPEETLALIRRAEPAPPSCFQPRVPAELEAICLACLHKDPARRPSAHDLAQQLHRFLDGETSSEPSTPEPVTEVSELPEPELLPDIRELPEPEPVAVSPPPPLPSRRGLVLPILAVAATVLLASVLAYQLGQPGYLHLEVHPPSAEVLLDGEPIELDEEGQALLVRPPGTYHLEVSAPGHIAHERDVVLWRGRGNLVRATMALVPLTGFLRIGSTPPGAIVEVVDPTGIPVAAGVTPFRTGRLPSGPYMVRLRLPDHLPETVRVLVPSGDRLHDAGTITLQREGNRP